MLLHPGLARKLNSNMNPGDDTQQHSRHPVHFSFNAKQDNVNSVLKTLDFHSEVLDVLIGGRSTIDSPIGFEIRTATDAQRFIESYGYQLSDPIEAAEGLGNFQESLNFIRRYFLYSAENPDGLKLEVPRRILELTDVRELLLVASAPEGSRESKVEPGIGSIRDWGCALLKVMHTVAHMDKDLRSPYFSTIQKQILDRYYRNIHREGADGSGALYLGEKSDDPLRVNLVEFQTKPKKSRDSILLKLLHKPENVAEDIFDRVGLRFITHTKVDAVCVVKYLRDRMIVSPPNIKPSRSRNSLLSTEQLKNALAEARTATRNTGTHPLNQPVKFLEWLEEKIRLPQTASSDNPHSSDHYASIHFTCRQLIKVENPNFAEMRELKQLAKKGISLPQEVLQVLDRIDLKHVQREVRFFYPYEVQIMDERSFIENEQGRSAHKEYKRAQRRTAQLRVMGNLADAPTQR